MNFRDLVLLTLTSSAIAFSGLAISADSEKAESAGEVKSDQVPAKKKVKSHSHPRDAKGMGVADKSDSEAQTTKPRTKVKPHSHMRDAKGMSVADKPDSKAETVKPGTDQK